MLKINLVRGLVDESSYLNNVKYNDTMIKGLLSEDGFKDGEISYELKKPESAKSNFSQYLQEIVEDEDKDKLPDIG